MNRILAATLTPATYWADPSYSANLAAVNGGQKVNVWVLV
jgi:hypothetical protein